MKRFFTLLCAVVAFAACEQVFVDVANDVAESDRSLSVSFEGDETRVQLNEAQKTVWTEGDRVSVFYRSTVNEEWQFMGETGDRTGQIVPVDNSVNPPATHNHVVVAYPYSEDYFYNTETHNVEVSLPAVQSYLKDSYGANGNIMISSSEFNKVSLKSVCGWLKLQLTGDGEVVKSITLRGNDGEQVAGLIYVDSDAATATLASASGDAGESEVGGTLVRPGTILTEVTLDCGEGVALGKNATAFYIALPPQTLKKGFTVDIKCDNYKPMTLSTTNTLTIKRNHIQPMAGVEHNAIPVVPNNQIWYTSSDGNIVEPNYTDVFSANIISNEYNNGMGVITFDGDVTTIGDWTFCNCYNLTSVNIPDSVTTIGDSAFQNCNSLTSVNIPSSVTTIGESAFCYCTRLTSVNIPDSVTTIGNYAFYDCDSLTSVNIGDSVTTIGKQAFERCTSLTSVNIPDSVTSIGGWAFSDCTSLTSVTIGDSVTTIGNYAFSSCDSLTSVNIPDSVTTIGEGAFYSCDSLTSVNIPDSVTTIGNYAFYKCTRLTSVTIPDSVTEIGKYAFYFCNSLKSVYCKATTPPSLGGTDVFDYNGSGRKIYVPAGSVNAYKSAEYWSEYADAIVGYDFEKGEVVEMQPNNEIWYTSSDGNVVVPKRNDVFGANIISNKYDNGKGVIIFDGNVTTIGYYAFEDCDSLTSVTIGDSVTTIGEGAFFWCDSLISVNIPDSVTTIGDWTFCNCHNLTSVNIPDSVTTIGNSVFYGCDSLTSVNIPDSVTSIGSQAFYDCTSLTSVNIPDSVTTIGEGAFFWCDSLTCVTIPDSVTTIGESAFRNCDSLTSVNIPDSVTEIGDVAFYYCSSLTSVYCKATTPPALGSNVFDDNGSGRKIYVPTESVSAYKSATIWNRYASAIVGYDFENGEVVE